MRRIQAGLWLVACLAILAYPASAAAQGAPGPAPLKPLRAPNTIYVEGLGPGGLYSVNYERLIIQDLAVRVGFSYVSFSASAGSSSASAGLAFFPITASYIGISTASKAHCLELGGGATILYATATSSTGDLFASGSGVGVAGTAMVGYRLHPIGYGFSFRIGFSPLFGSGGFLPWGYLSLGGSF